MAVTSFLTSKMSQFDFFRNRIYLSVDNRLKCSMFPKKFSNICFYLSKNFFFILNLLKITF